MKVCTYIRNDPVIIIRSYNIDSKTSSPISNCNENTYHTKQARSHKVKLCPSYDVYMQRFEEKTYPKYYDSDPKFLSTNSFEKVILASYPRSGNTLLRKYLEQITKVITGSDSSIKRRLVKDLKDRGMHGEGIVDSRVWVVKTHYPERHENIQYVINLALNICIKSFIL